MHSHHSHSGEYISHGNGLLDDIVSAAAARGFSHYCLTEHMPRSNDAYLYPEEQEKGYTQQHLSRNFQCYLEHARRIQKSSTMHILVGFEVEGVDTQHILAAKHLMSSTDMCVGSTHHVHGIPIDFDAARWLECQQISGSTRRLFLDYFLLQGEMIRELQPHVVGHFDLIRLFMPESATPSSLRRWPDVWAAMCQNIEHVVSYGGLFELNSASIRKGWSSPYPQADICQLIMDLGGKFCLSDDAHSVEQVGLNYRRTWAFLRDELKLKNIYHLEKSHGKTVVIEDSVADLDHHEFWK